VGCLEAANSATAVAGCSGHEGACHHESYSQEGKRVPQEGIESICPECWLIGVGEVRGTAAVAEQVIPEIVITGTKPIVEGEVVRSGEFSIWNWTNYPNSIPKPTGTFRLLEGAEKDAARKAANQANRALHKSDESLGGWELHEIKPVKFNGSPTDIENKMPLPAGAHSEVTTWWNTLMRDLTPNP